MAKQDAAEAALRAEQNQRLRLMAVVTAVIVGLALLSVALSSGGSPLQRCKGVLVAGGKEQCYYQLAVSSGNATLCGNLTLSYSESCYLSIAESHDNASMCPLTGNQSGAALCTSYVANATGRYGLCYSLNGTYRDSCLSTIAMDSHNASLCSGIGNNANRTICSSSIAFADALRLKNKDYCGSVTSTTNTGIMDGVLQGSTALDYGRVSSNLSTYIMMLAFMNNTGISPRDLCYLSYASQFGNQSACTGISNSTMQQSCAIIAAPPSNSTSSGTENYTVMLNYCRNTTITGTNLSAQNNCAELVMISKAVVTRNSTICSSLNASGAEQCYVSLASQYSNTTYCTYLSNALVRNACYQDATYNASAAFNGTVQPVP